MAMPIPCRPPGVPANHGRKDPIVPHYRIPRHAAGLRIGLFGGTFDPPHHAHLAASLLALKRLRLDRVWWLVTPGNPLKDSHGLAPIEERTAAARALARHPRIAVVHEVERPAGTFERAGARRVLPGLHGGGRARVEGGAHLGLPHHLAEV